LLFVVVGEGTAGVLEKSVIIHDFRQTLGDNITLLSRHNAASLLHTSVSEFSQKMEIFEKLSPKDAFMIGRLRGEFNILEESRQVEELKKIAKNFQTHKNKGE
jgi:DNA-binding transcriptional regulator YdaS (Cro superfamily)